ncbi:hypothetical protein TNIN_253581 [Trichonephila inaurata madagascariensis]|uniref:Uncharacterized protein n=1 Tax=Trichonephila inaurata madagascariensis TaxID=2747483 RepID=A0A8X7CQC9_9ARAC|nr:hypothetical protein TNIN_253581 [Trichonephila inaurata madagascariensis]
MYNSYESNSWKRRQYKTKNPAIPQQVRHNKFPTDPFKVAGRAAPYIPKKGMTSFGTDWLSFRIGEARNHRTLSYPLLHQSGPNEYLQCYCSPDGR